MTIIDRDVASAPTDEIAEATTTSSLRDNLQSRCTTHRVGLAVGVVLIVLAHAVNATNWPLYGDDEGTYVAQGWAVLSGELAHYTYWYDHPPLGWVQLSVLFAIPDALGWGPTMGMARLLMVVFAATTAVLIYRLSRNVGVNYVTGLIAMLLWGLSPLVVFESRQVFLDNIQLPWLVGAFVLATSGRRRLLQHVAAGACFGIAVLTKETALVMVPAFLLAVWVYSYRPTRVFSLMGAGVMLALVVIVYPLFALLKGELVPGPDHVSLVDAIQFQLVSREGSGVMWDRDSGARLTVEGWLELDAVLPLAGVLAGFCCLISARLRPIGLGLTILTLIALRPDGYLPAMYVAGALPFAAVALAAVGERTVKKAATLRLAGTRIGPALVTCLVAIAAIAIVPGWAQGHHRSLTVQQNDGYSSALRYAEEKLPRDSQILADDSYWPNLVEEGWNPDGWNGPIWYYKLDLDPVARDRALANGWRDIDFVIANEDLRRGVRAADKPQLRAAYQHSVVVAEWGSGAGEVEIRRVEPDLDPSLVAEVP